MIKNIKMKIQKSKEFFVVVVVVVSPDTGRIPTRILIFLTNIDHLFLQMACFEILKNFSYLVTTQALQVKTNMLLSVLKIAEVDVLLPASNSWSTEVLPNTWALAFSLVTIAVLF